MIYQKAKAAVINFEGFDIFMASSSIRRAVMENLRNMCSNGYTYNLATGDFTCLLFSGSAGQTIYAKPGDPEGCSFDPDEAGSTSWHCRVY